MARASGEETAESSRQTTGLHAGICTPTIAHRLPGRKRTDYQVLVVGGSGRGGYERKVRAGCRQLELCPGQAEAPSAVGEIDTKEAERHGNLFNFCQSRREEDNSQTGMM